MITLNLLSPNKKKELRLMQFYGVAKNLIIFILFITSLVAIVLLLTKMVLQNNFNKIVAENTLTTRYANLFNKDVKEFNQYVRGVGKIQEEYTPWVNFFTHFSQLVPNNIIIYTLNINQDKILITGLGGTRDELLKFKDELEKSELFSKVAIPLDNLLKKDNVDFSIKANISLDRLKNYDQ